jgi:hypothetical protein
MSASLKAATSPVRPEQLVCPCTSQIPGNTFPGQWTTAKLTVYSFFRSLFPLSKNTVFFQSVIF